MISSDNEGQILAMAIDPIEKKPLFEFYPGSTILSIGTFGCNLACPWCQNHALISSRSSSNTTTPTLAVLASELLNRAIANHVLGIAFTYNEPLLWHHTVMEISKTFKAHGLKTVMVSNGCAQLHIVEKLLPLIDAWNVDLKTTSAADYRAIHGDLNTVLATIKAIIAHGAHLEVTYLIVPNFNDSKAALLQLADIIFELGVPVLHLTRYFPAHRCNEAPTSEKTMNEALELVKSRLKECHQRETTKTHTSVYLGNCSWVHNL